MARFIDIHVLQYLPISCVNRDDSGMPKTISISGVRRARWSSQSQKRLVRNRMRELLPADDLSVRTRLLPQMVLEALIEKGMDPAEARKAAAEKVQFPLLKKVKAEGAEAVGEDDTSDLATKVLLSVPGGAADRIAEGILSGEKGFDDEAGDKDKTKAISEKLRQVSLDTTLFGRFIASLELRTDGAVSVAHAVGTTPDGFTSEWWTAIDDEKVVRGGDRVGGMGSQGLTSGVLYRYATIDLGELERNAEEAGIDADLRENLVRIFLEEFSLLRPEAMKRSTAPMTDPALVRLDVTERPRSLVTAFTEPVHGADVVAESVQRLARHAESLDQAYGPALSTVTASTVDGHGQKDLDTAISETLAAAKG